MILAIWNEFIRFVADAAPAFAVGPTLAAGVQWVAAHIHRAAESSFLVAQSFPGAALAGTALPGAR